MVYKCKMISPGIFFHFLKILIFQVFRAGGGVKRQKMTHNYKFQSVTLYISQEL